MNWVKVTILLTAVAVTLFLIAANFSTVQANYKCSGSLFAGSQSSLEVAYLRIETYRPWVGLWSNSDGSVMFEIPRKTTEYFESVQETSINMQIGNSGAPFSGTFSTISRTLALDTAIGHYEGACQLVATGA